MGTIGKSMEQTCIIRQSPAIWQRIWPPHPSIPCRPCCLRSRSPQNQGRAAASVLASAVAQAHAECDFLWDGVFAVETDSETAPDFSRCVRKLVDMPDMPVLSSLWYLSHKVKLSKKKQLELNESFSWHLAYVLDLRNLLIMPLSARNLGHVFI